MAQKRHYIRPRSIKMPFVVCPLGHFRPPVHNASILRVAGSSRSLALACLPHLWYAASMHYLSTRGGDDPLLFRATVLTGLARDGGLFLPSDIPDVRDRLTAWARLSYADLAYEIMRLYADDIPAPALRAMVDRSYAVFRHPEVTPVVTVGNVHVLELFHGPTLAFKDVALQFLGNLFEYVLAETGGELNIVAATSGDTGSAAIHGVRGRDRMRIFVLHPQGRVSPVQERQMTSVLDANVHNLAVAGTFDDYQNLSLIHISEPTRPY